MRPHNNIDLIRQHEIYETNYQRIMRLLPVLFESDQDNYRLPLTRINSPEWLIVRILERAPFTTLLKMQMDADWGHLLNIPEAEVRLYHDAQMAETVYPHHPIANMKYDHLNEKQRSNTHLALWLNYLLSSI